MKKYLLNKIEQINIYFRWFYLIFSIMSSFIISLIVNVFSKNRISAREVFQIVINAYTAVFKACKYDIEKKQIQMLIYGNKNIK